MILALLLSVLTINTDTASNTYYAATSYTNAKEFYNSTGLTTPYHVELTNGSIYYATRGKLASSSTNLRYATVGFDITMSTSDCSVSFQLQRTESSYLKVVDPERKDDTYLYNLYVIDEKSLYKLAELVSDKATVEKLMSSSIINVRIDAIITTLRGSTLHGSVQEDGQGKLVEDGTLYHLKNENEWEALKELFPGHDFSSHRKIEEDLENYSLTMDYNVVGTKDDNIGCTSTVSAGNGYTVSKDYLYYNGKEVLDTYRVLQQFYLPDVSSRGIDLKKLGYHLLDDAEWKTSDGRTFSDSELLMPKDIEPGVGFKNKFVIMYANWQPNKYTIKYSSAGGSGTVSPTVTTYDKEGRLANNTYSKSGYYLPSGAEWIDANGNTYANGESVLNWTAVDGATITLYANWKPSIVDITTDKQGGTGGTDVFYQKYGYGFYSDSNATVSITGVMIPTMMGYNFMGYYTGLRGSGNLIIGTSGSIEALNTYFTMSQTIYANWKGKQYPIDFDKRGGTGGTDSALATYNECFPSADAPVRDGYTFMGYYTEADGNGTQIYNEFMSSSGKYLYTSGITLYAYWEDDIAPEITLMVSCANWTNQTVTLTADAEDYGIGLSSVNIYRILEDGTEIPVAQSSDLNGAESTTVTYENPIEGVVRYKAVATDINGLASESYNVVYYDITPPSGSIIDMEINGSTFYFEIDITDINNGD